MTAVQFSAQQALPGTVPRAVPRAVPQVGAPRLRLTRRGRMVFTSVVAGPLAVLAIIVALNGGIAAAADASLATSSQSFTYVTIHAGQSLWHVAETVAPTADPRDVISDIMRLNQLDSSAVHPGDRIAIPTQYSRP